MNYRSKHLHLSPKWHRVRWKIGPLRFTLSAQVGPSANGPKAPRTSGKIELRWGIPTDNQSKEW